MAFAKLAELLATLTIRGDGDSRGSGNPALFTRTSRRPYARSGYPAAASTDAVTPAP
ncbi:hypothetical protein [Amycolatopsis sp. WQ 127309]|uniref:hypothetical protein n=1 Tax=Amycolatopsis sp. WQ 127309 TaxID=2932773 RepID=UPI001FF1CC85|nr:hypothetical protein [Amycolatopsis sp. WQ 127309]UOZ03864.1 hypothetical protein MUY22_34115 [Amycolatopsis sp. WQ 127309]